MSRFTQRSASELYACLGSDNGRSLRRAVAILDIKGVPAAEFLINLLARDIQDFRRSRRRRTWLLIETIAFFMLAHGRFLLGWPIHNQISVPCILLFLLLMQVLTRHCEAHYRQKRRIRNLLFLLQEEPPVERTGVFVDVMRYGDSDASCLAQAILLATLPQVRDKNSLSQQQHTALCRALRGTNANLILAILAAFEQIGISRSRRAVWRLISCPVWLADAKRIERAANACLLAMQERARQEAVAEMLLRATMPTVPTHYMPTSHMLLRPVEDSASSLEPARLVR